jgi:hypothetical protein
LAKYAIDFHAMKPLCVLVVIASLVLCVLWTFMIWPGSRSGGQFYAYPVSAPLVGFWAAGWVVILLPTYFILKKLRK